MGSDQISSFPAYKLKQIQAYKIMLIMTYLWDPEVIIHRYPQLTELAAAVSILNSKLRRPTMKDNLKIFKVEYPSNQ